MCSLLIGALAGAASSWRVNLNTRRNGRWGAKSLITLLNLATALLVLIALAVQVPISVLGLIGPPFFSAFAPQIALVTAGAAALCWWRWRVAPGRAMLVLAVCAVLATTTDGVAVGRTLALARSEGVRIDMARALGLNVPSTSPAPRMVTYDHDGSAAVRLAIFRPPPSPRPAPVLVYIHGGGWIGGDFLQRENDMRWFAAHGLLTISVEYSLSSAQRHLWGQTQGQITCAMAWVGAHALTLHGDARRIALLGDSAGGNLALNTAYLADSGRLTPSCGGRAPHVSAVVSLYPVVDLVSFYRDADPLLSPFAHMMASYYIGGSPEQYPARYASRNPTPLLGRTSPPTLLVVGEDDDLVAPQPTYRLAEILKQMCLPMHLIRLPYAGHAFDVSAGSMTNQLVLKSSLNFLRGHGLGA